MTTEEEKELAELEAKELADLEAKERFDKGYTGAVSPVSAFIRGAGQGASLGFMDEAIGALPGITKEELQGSLSRAKKEHPYLTEAGDLAGSFIPGVASGGVAMLSKLSPVAKYLAGKFGRVAPAFAGRVGLAGAEGGARAAGEDQSVAAGALSAGVLQGPLEIAGKLGKRFVTWFTGLSPETRSIIREKYKKLPWFDYEPQPGQEDEIIDQVGKVINETRNLRDVGSKKSFEILRKEGKEIPLDEFKSALAPVREKAYENLPGKGVREKLESIDRDVLDIPGRTLEKELVPGGLKGEYVPTFAGKKAVQELQEAADYDELFRSGDPKNYAKGLAAKINELLKEGKYGSEEYKNLMEKVAEQSQALAGFERLPYIKDPAAQQHYINMFLRKAAKSSPKEMDALRSLSDLAGVPLSENVERLAMQKLISQDIGRGSREALLGATGAAALGVPSVMGAGVGVMQNVAGRPMGAAANQIAGLILDKTKGTVIGDTLKGIAESRGIPAMLVAAKVLMPYLNSKNPQENN